MSYIKDYIEKLNGKNRKALSIFLTAGFPNKNNFIDLAKQVLDSGADMLNLEFLSAILLLMDRSFKHLQKLLWIAG